MSDRETNTVILTLAEIAAAIERREREAAERRAKMRAVDSPKRRGHAA